MVIVAGNWRSEVQNRSRGGEKSLRLLPPSLMAGSGRLLSLRKLIKFPAPLNHQYVTIVQP
jgi:hypothetical protein